MMNLKGKCVIDNEIKVAPVNLCGQVSGKIGKDKYVRVFRVKISDAFSPLVKMLFVDIFGDIDC